MQPASTAQHSVVFTLACLFSDDPLHFNPAQSDPDSPLSNETSICREWYISDGPVTHGSNKAAADALKSAADGNWIKGGDISNAVA